MFLDADTLVLRNIDRLFDYPELCAAPNVYEALADFHRMNSGVFTARPSQATFDRLLAQLDAPGAFWKRTDQTFLQEAFPDWHGLPVIYNTLQYVWLNLPGLWDWARIRVLHFQYEKPWEDHAKADRLRPLIDLWHAYAGDGAVPDLVDAAAAGMQGRRPPAPVSGGSAAQWRPDEGRRHRRDRPRGAVRRGAPARRATRSWRWAARRPRTGAAPAWRLGERAPLEGCDALVHCAFAHAPGRYRGGEGDDPEGSCARTSTARCGSGRRRGACRCVFLSSRAVYDGLPPGTVLTEDMPLAPDSLYGQVKLAAEEALHAQGGASLRATGVYGPPAPGQRHKWADLFDAFARGETASPAPRDRGAWGDLARGRGAPPRRRRRGPYNCSDLLLDRRDLLERVVAASTGVEGRLPPRSDAPRTRWTARGCARWAGRRAARRAGWTLRPWGGALPRCRPDRPLPPPEQALERAAEDARHGRPLAAQEGQGPADLDGGDRRPGR